MNPSEVVTLRELITYAPGSTVSKVLNRTPGGNLTLFAFDQGQQLSEHTAPFDATVLVLDGTCMITIDGKEHTLSEGQAIIMPADIPHALFATTSFKMLLIMQKK